MAKPFEHQIKELAAELLQDDPDTHSAVSEYAMDLRGFDDFNERMAFLKQCAQEKAYEQLTNQEAQAADMGDCRYSMEREDEHA